MIALCQPEIPMFPKVSRVALNIHLDDRDEIKFVGRRSEQSICFDI